MKSSGVLNVASGDFYAVATCRRALVAAHSLPENDDEQESSLKKIY